MNPLRRLVFLLPATIGWLVADSSGADPLALPPPPVSTPVPGVPGENPLVWDSTRKIHRATPGQVTATYVFLARNSGTQPVEIARIEPTCGCTVVALPASPWVLAPGEAGSFTAQLDFAGKQGQLTRTIEVHSSAGRQVLTIGVEIPATDPAVRRRNQEIARADRQAVFRNDCAACHSAPAAGKRGAELFTHACGICHSAPARADMVPDLQIARQPRDADYWRKWIREGKADSLMPAFAQEHGGPLADAQVESLVEHLLAALPTQPKVLPALGEARPLPKLPVRKRE